MTTIASMLQALAAGLVMGVYYDVFRLLRRIIRFQRFWVAVQDMIFWLSSAIGLFFVCIALNNGFIRIYFILLALGGWGLYYLVAGRCVFAVIDWIIKFFRRTIRRMKTGFSTILDKKRTTT